MLESLAYGAVLLIGLLLALASGLWVALSLMLVAIVGLLFAGNHSIPLVLATSAWGTVANWGLVALPLFIWMGEILHRTRLSEDLFRGLAPWLQRFPGGLLHVNMVSCGIFAAISGSSAATAATVGRMTLPVLRERGYSESSILGTLAGSGTLGLLIPPSIILIVYGIAAEVSIARLFAAGVFPGLLLLVAFVLYVVIVSVLKPRAIQAEKSQQAYAQTPLSLHQAWLSIKALAPITLIIFAILGSMYTGLMTPTEAAAFGVIFALVIAAFTQSLTSRGFYSSLMGATKTTSMIILILVAASFLTMSMGFLQIPTQLAAWVSEQHLHPVELLVALTVMFILLGLFLDGISVVLLTTSIVLPMVEQAGIDLLWFGIYLVVVVEMSQITPPVGFNLFILQGLSGKSILMIARAALPFFFILLSSLVLFWFVPELITWLPSQL